MNGNYTGTEDNATKLWNVFAPEVILEPHKTKRGYNVLVSIGEDYYETDCYQFRDLALCEVKGFLEGVKAKIEGTLQSIERQINEDNQDTSN